MQINSEYDQLTGQWRASFCVAPGFTLILGGKSHAVPINRAGTTCQETVINSVQLETPITVNIKPFT